ncbi:hypothetical protein SDC9_59416 [bioreactor metagenome]|uniref:DUF2806 domain-containing protein n=1 Tax=bioreactor metagenome TaxID=1076179 RepID=A0A644XBC1_9ZZZZ|nr:DUF2806 domain-containing protein [Aminivibrio sp.]MEA4953641.1 DUF2806 domain-containing protein [Aminivibrio sp.]
MSENPIAKLGDLSKPATFLIEKISDALGGFFKPFQIVRCAKAEAQAAIIEAESHIQVTDLYRRAAFRFFEEEAKKQSNIENITQEAILHLNEEASPQDVQDDWITNFFDKCRIVSDADMQKLWSRLLAEEANLPGKFSRKTVNLLADLDKSDADLFVYLCSFCWTINNYVPLVFDVHQEIYSRHYINFNALSHLESLGLVHFNDLAGYRRMKLPKKITVSYYERPVELTFPKDTENDLSLGKVLLTQAGQELFPICGSKPIDEFFDFVYASWEEQSLVPKR